MAYKTFQNGFPLPASDLNTFLMNQSVIVFDGAANRTSTLPTPTEGMVTYLKDTNKVQYYTGTAWVDVNDNSDAILKSLVTTEGDLIVGTGSATVARLAKGTAGQVLTAGASTVSFETPTPAVPLSTVTTAGDLIVATGSGAVTRLGKGTDGQVLSVVAGELAYAAPSADGMTLLSTTALSGVSTTISSIPGTFKNLKLVIKNFDMSAGARPRLRFNSDTGSNYYLALSSATSTLSKTTFLEFNQNGGDLSATSGAVMQWETEVIEYASDANAKLINSVFLQGNRTTATSRNLFIYTAGYENSAAINSVTIFSDDGTTTFSGSALLYGVK